MQKKIKTLLTIAGSDPTGGAGIQADLRTGISLGLHVQTAITSVTVQNSKGFYEIGDVTPKLLKKQLFAIVEDGFPDAVKIGMIGSLDNLKVIEDFLNYLPSGIPIIVDPVFQASSNGEKLNRSGLDQLARYYNNNIFPKVAVITPNVREFKVLMKSLDEHQLDIKIIKNTLKVPNIIITSGDSDIIKDILITPSESFVYTHHRINCQNLHGTGCTYSSIIASYMALGYSIVPAFHKANRRMHKIIKESCKYSLAQSSYGPLNINKYKI